VRQAGRPVAAVYWQERDGVTGSGQPYDETGYTERDRAQAKDQLQKILHIADGDAKIATGRLTAEIKIGPLMIDMIERSATHAKPAHGK
jgi:hypothetical protein